MMAKTSHDGEDGDLMTDIHKIESVLSAARRLMGEGKVVDLSALEAKIQSVCAVIAAQRQTADAETRSTLTALLEGLLSALDTLSDDLEAQHRRFTEAVERTAGRAYGQSITTDKD